MAISLFDMRRIIHSEKKSKVSSNLKIIETWAEFDESGNNTNERPLEYLCFEMETIDPATGQKNHFYKAIKFARVIRLPKSAKQSTALMDMQTQVLTAVWEQEFNFITVIANIREPVALGLLFLYGVQGVAKTLDEAKEQCRQAFIGMIATLQGTYRVLEMRVLNAQETDWLREKLYNMEYTTVVRGIPKASKTGEDMGNKGIGGANLNPDSQGTLEEIIIGMADYEYVIEILTTPVHYSTLRDWSAVTRRQMTEWQERMQGTKGFSMNLSIPMMYGANQGTSQSANKGYTSAESVNVSQGTSYNASYGENVGQALSQSYGQSFGKAYGQSFSESISQTHTVSQGVTMGRTMGISVGTSQGQSIGQNVSQSQSQNIGNSFNQSVGRSFGESVGTNQGVSASQNVGFSTGMSRGASLGSNVGQSANFTQGVSAGSSYGQSIGQGRSQGYSVSNGMSSGQSFGSSQNISQNLGSSRNESMGRSVNQGFSQSYGSSLGQSSGSSYGTSHGTSQNTGYSMGRNESQSVGQNFGSSQGISASTGHSQSVGNSASSGWNESESVGQNQSASANRNFSYSEGANSGANSSVGLNASNSHTDSKGQNDSLSVQPFGIGYSHGWNNNQSDTSSTGASMSAGTSEGVSVGYGSSGGYGESVGASYSQGQGVSGSLGQSASLGSSSSLSGNLGISQGASQSQSAGISEGYNASYGKSASENFSVNQSTSASQSITNGMSSGVSDSYSVGNGYSNGMSQGYGTSYGQNLGESHSEGLNYGVSQNQGQSYGVNSSQSMSQGYGQSYGQSYSENTGISQSQSQGMSQGYSQGSSYGQNAGMSASESQGTSIGQSLGVSKGYSVSANVGTSQSRSESQSYSVSQSESWSTSHGFTKGESYTESTSESMSTGQTQSYGQSKSIGQGQSSSKGYGSSQSQTQGYSMGLTQGASASMGISPSLGYSKTYQWLDQEVKDIVEMLEFKNERLKNALRGSGAFYSYVYIACPNLDALSAAKTLAKSTWQNEMAMIQPLQILDLNESEQQDILMHCMGFSANPTMSDYFDDYKYCSVLLPKEMVSYTHLPRVSEGGLFTEVGDVPKFSVPSMLKGEIYMGTILSAERYTMKSGYKTPFQYRIDERELMHMYFTGSSRSGKTVAAMRFVAELTRVRRKSTGKRLRIVCMDPKQDWRKLARYVEPERFRFYNMGNTLFRPLHLNPLKIPHGVIPQMWIDGVIDIYCRAYGLLERGKQMMGETIYQLYHEAGVFGYTTEQQDMLRNKYVEEYKKEYFIGSNDEEGRDRALQYANDRIEKENEDIKKNRAPDLISEMSSHVTFVKVYDRMNLIKRSMEGDTEAEALVLKLTGEKKGKSGNDTKDAYARLLDRLQAFNREFSVERQLFGTEEGISVDELIGEDDVTVLESKGLENTFRNFVFGVITSGFYKFALAHEGGFLAEDQYETLLVIEEANEVLTGSDVAGTGGGASFGMTGESEFEQILDQSAGYGLFICAITQKISDMPKSIIANAGLIFAGRLKIPDDITTVIRSVAREDKFEDRDLVKWFPRSPTGWFICMSSRTFDFKDSEPILVNIAPLNMNAPTNAEIDELLTLRSIQKNM